MANKLIKKINQYDDPRQIIIKKLKNSVTNAYGSRIIENIPMMLPQQWLVNTAYTSSKSIVLNLGNIYQCYTSGTSAAAGSGPVSTDGMPETDNTAKWVFIGKAYRATDDPTAPTVTVNTDKSALTQSVLASTDGVTINPVFEIYGAQLSIATSGSIKYIISLNRDSAVPPASPNYAGGSGTITVQFSTDANYIAINGRRPSYINTQVLIRVNDQLINLESHKFPSTTAPNPSWWYVDLSTLGYGIGVKNITLHLSDFDGVFLPPDAKIWPYKPANQVKIVGFGDSKTPIAIGDAMDSWWYRIGMRLGTLNTHGIGLATSGFISTNPAPHQYRSKDLIGSNPDIIVIHGAVNDAATAAHQTAIKTFLRTIRASLPYALIFFTTNAVSGTVSNIDDKETSITQAVESYNASSGDDVVLIPIQSDTLGEWFTGTGRITAPESDGNMDWLSLDNLHLVTNGNIYLGERLYEKIKEWIDLQD